MEHGILFQADRSPVAVLNLLGSDNAHYLSLTHYSSA